MTFRPALLGLVLLPLGACATAPLSEPSMHPIHYLERGEGRVAYDDTGGEGPLVLAIPGLGDVRGEYRFLRDALHAEGYRVVTMDLRGHGDSDVGFTKHGADVTGEDALALLEHLDAGPAVVIGTSAGAGAATYAAALDPEKVRGLVLVGPFVRDHETGVLIKVAMKVLFGGPWRVSAWLWYFDTLFPTTKPADHEAYKAALAANLAQPGRFDAAMALMNASKQSVDDRLHDVKAPTLVVMGTKDPDFPDPAAEARLVAERTHGEVVLIEGAGHYPHAEMPDETAPAILSFLASLGR